jgi:phage FluMu protein Com
MPVPIRCPSCATVSTAPDAAAGKKVKCPKCKQVLILPAPSHAVAPIPPAVPRKPTLDSLGVVEDAPLDSLDVVEKGRSSATARRWLWWAVGGVSVALLVAGVVIIGVLVGRRTGQTPAGPPKEVVQFISEARSGANLLEFGGSVERISKLVDTLVDLKSRLPTLSAEAEEQARLVVTETATAQELARMRRMVGRPPANSECAANIRRAADRLEALCR